MTCVEAFLYVVGVGRRPVFQSVFAAPAPLVEGNSFSTELPLSVIGCPVVCGLFLTLCSVPSMFFMPTPHHLGNWAVRVNAETEQCQSLVFLEVFWLLWVLCVHTRVLEAACHSLCEHLLELWLASQRTCRLIAWLASYQYRVFQPATLCFLPRMWVFQSFPQ